MNGESLAPNAALVDASLPGEHLRLGTFGWRSLTLLGASLTAAGCYAPWSYGIDSAGWPGMLVAFALVGTFYFCLLQCLAEMSAAIPSSGAGQAFASEAFGPVFGFVAGAAALVQWVCGAAALAVLLAAYTHALTGIGAATVIIVTYAVLVGILLTGAGEAIMLTLFVSLLAIAGVAVFIFYAGGAAGAENFADLNLAAIQASGVWLALPFAVTFFLGLEGVPFAAEEAKKPARDVPIGLLLSLALVAILGSLVLILGPAGVGLPTLRGSGEPILAGLSAARIGASPIVVQAVTLAAILGLATSLFSSIYAYSRQIFAMARDGELPRLLGHLNRRGAPAAALIIPSLIGVVVALTGALNQVIVVMVFSACLSYTTMFVSFIGLRRRRPDLLRPYKVRFAWAVIAIGVILGLVIFSACVAADPLWSSIGGGMLAALLLYRIAARWRGAGSPGHQTP